MLREASAAARGTARPDAACRARARPAYPRPADDRRWPPRTSLSQAALACCAPGAPAIRAFAAGLASATALKARRSPFSRFTRSIMAASASMAMNRQAASTNGGSAKRSVKSCALPSSTIRSACAQNLGEGAEARIVDAARAFHGHDGNAKRGLEVAAAAQDRRHGKAAGRPESAGGCACGEQRPMKSRWSRRAANGCSCGAKSAAAGPAASARPRLSPPADRTAGSDARGPGRPDRAMRTASASSVPSVAAERATHDALVTGSAMSAWRSSWKAPRPTSLRPACPDNSTSGDSPACAVHSAAAALVKPAPPLTQAMPHWPVRRPHASAMCTAAASWRTWISLQPRADRRIEQRHDVVARQREDRGEARRVERAGNDVGASDGLACAELDQRGKPRAFEPISRSKSIPMRASAAMLCVHAALPYVRRRSEPWPGGAER